MGDRHIIEDPDLVEKGETDSKGRINLGSEYSDKEVKVAVQVIGDKQENTA